MSDTIITKESESKLNDPQSIEVPKAEDYQSFEVSFKRKRDGQFINVKILEIFRQLFTADFTNNEIILNGEVCHLNSFQKRQNIMKLTIGIVSNGGNGCYTIDGLSYTGEKEFPVEMSIIKVISCTPDENSQTESVKDSNGQVFAINLDGTIDIPINGDVNIVITFCAKINNL